MTLTLVYKYKINSVVKFKNNRELIKVYITFHQNSFYKLKLWVSREEGIRTLDTLLTYTRFPSVRLKPLGHLSILLIIIKNFF